MNCILSDLKKCANIKLVLLGLSLTQTIYAQNEDKNTQNVSSAKQIQLNLETAMNMSENYSLSVKMSNEDYIASDSQESAYFRNLFPTVSLSGKYLFNDSSVNKLVGSGITGMPKDVTSTAALSLSQPILGLYGSIMQVNQYASLTRAAYYNKNLSKENARIYGAKTYINAQNADHLLKIAQSTVAVSEKQLQDAQAQFNAGKLTNADLLKIKLSLEKSKTSLIQAQTSYKIAILSLSEAIGIKDFSTISLNNSDKSIFEDRANNVPDFGSIFTPAFAKRNDILSAKESINANYYAKMNTISKYLPTLNFVATYSRDFQADDLNTGTKVYSKNDIQDSFSYGVEFSWLIWDWGSRQAQISAASSAEQKAKYNYESILSQAKIDITTNYYKLKDAFQVLDSAKVSVQYAEDSYSQMKARFDNGQVTATDLISSSNDQASARADLATAKGALDLAWMNYLMSIGAKLTTLK